MCSVKTAFYRHCIFIVLQLFIVDPKDLSALASRTQVYFFDCSYEIDKFLNHNDGLQNS